MFSSINQGLRNWAEKDGRGYPDWATRYLPVVAGLKQRGLLDGSILEIGANANGLSRFTGRKVVAIDLAVEHLQEAGVHQDIHRVASDITQLPFPDNHFDTVVCMDTFEHVPESMREYAALEILRVLKPAGSAVVAFPSGSASQAAEAQVRAAYAAYSEGGSIRWLEEHVAEGLPDGQTVAGYFMQGAVEAYTVTVMGNTNLKLWIWMWKVLMCGWPGKGNGVAQAVLRILTPWLARQHGGTCYRKVIWVDPVQGGKP